MRAAFFLSGAFAAVLCLARATTAQQPGPNEPGAGASTPAPPAPATATAAGTGSASAAPSGEPHAPPSPDASAVPNPDGAAPSASESAPPPLPPDFSEPKVRQVPVPGSDINMGVATIGIRAPMAKVRRVLMDYGHYDEVLPKLELSRVVGRTKDGATDVYVRVPILHGVSHVWGKLRFDKPEPYLDKGEVIRSELIEGNFGSWHARWKLWPCGAQRTILTMKLHLELDVPVPDSMVGDTLAWAADHSVSAVRDIAECPPKP